MIMCINNCAGLFSAILMHVYLSYPLLSKLWYTFHEFIAVCRYFYIHLVK